MLDDQLDTAVLMPYLERKELPAKACVVGQGEAADDVFFLESGRLTASLATEGTEPVQLRVMGPGTVVGEVALYNRVARTASVFTDTPSCTGCRVTRSRSWSSATRTLPPRCTRSSPTAWQSALQT